MTNYYEAIIQLRPNQEDLLNFVKKEIEENNIKISKEIHTKYGVDLYISSNPFAISLGRKLKKRFKGEVKLSRSLYGIRRKTSKLAYRVTMCFRLSQSDQP